MSQEDDTCIFPGHLICNLIGLVQESSFCHMTQSRKAPIARRQQYQQLHYYRIVIKSLVQQKYSVVSSVFPTLLSQKAQRGTEREKPCLWGFSIPVNGQR